jgi:hypothetical protein
VTVGRREVYSGLVGPVKDWWSGFCLRSHKVPFLYEFEGVLIFESWKSWHRELDFNVSSEPNEYHAANTFNRWLIILCGLEM